MSHRHVERGPDCRSASSPRGTSSSTWDEPSTASLQCDSCGDEKGGPNRPTRRRSFMHQRHRAAVRHTILLGGATGRTRRAARTHPRGGGNDVAHPAQHSRERRHRQRQDDVPQRLDCPHPRRRADRGDRGHLGTPHRLPELRPFRSARAAARRGHDPRSGEARPPPPTPITSWSAKCAAAKPATSCKPSTPAPAARSPPSTPTTPRVPSPDWRAARCKAAAISRGT